MDGELNNVTTIQHGQICQIKCLYDGAVYDVDGWLNFKSVICKKYQDTGMTQVLVNLDG